MKPKVLHQQAMDYSFKAKQILEEGNYVAAFDLYKQAADLESQVAEFYFDKPELEPTRSIIIRSAAFLNLKAGLIDNAKRFIFYGLLHSTDSSIKSQLNDALELAVSLGNMSSEAASAELYYLTQLRQRSIHYILEPSTPFYGNSVGLEMIKDFSEGYLKSLKAFAVSALKRIASVEDEVKEALNKELEKIVNPLVTGSAYGSFKFSIANDFVSRDGERKEIVKLKANVISKFHNEIFINPLSDNDINAIREKYDEEEVNEIFRPLTKIKANTTPYKIGYYDTETFNKKFTERIINKQRQKLLTVKQITQDEIGFLESTIIHGRSSSDGKVTKKTIYKEQLKAYEFDYKTNTISPKDYAPLILNDEIILTIKFDSNTGFTISFDDFRVQYTEAEYDKSLSGFHDAFNLKLRNLARKTDKNMEEQKDWEAVSALIGNPDTLKN